MDRERHSAREQMCSRDNPGKTPWVGGSREEASSPLSWRQTPVQGARLKSLTLGVASDSWLCREALGCAVVFKS